MGVVYGWLSLRGAPPWGLNKMEKCVKRRATILNGGKARREARVPVVETAHGVLLLLRVWVQGVSVTAAASKRALLGSLLEVGIRCAFLCLLRASC